MCENVLHIEHISKTYVPGRKSLLRNCFSRKKKTVIYALNDMSFTFENGFYALLGPNGAGKTTLMSIISSNLHPDSGFVLFNGKSISRQGRKFRAILGYMPQQQALYNGFSGYEFLEYMCVLKGIKQNRVDEIERVSTLVSLYDELGKKLGVYSGGMRQRILAAAALIGNPKVILLDEPTAGLDPKERIRLRNKIAELSESSIVLMATHVVSDVESVVDNVLLLKNGTLICSGTVKELISEYCPKGNLEDVYLNVFNVNEEL